MAENEWGDEGEAPRKKRVPKWLWWTCGTGCFLALVCFGACVVLVRSLAQRALDPELAWKEVAEVLPFDRRPEGWDARGTTFLGVGQYYLVPPRPENAVLLVNRFHGRAELDAMFDPASMQNQGMVLFKPIHDAEVGTITVQGREVRCLRFRGPALQERDAEKECAHLRLDATGSGEIPVCVQIAVGDVERVADEKVEALLAPFALWRGR